MVMTVYTFVILLYAYFLTKRFEKGWIKNFFTGKYNQKGGYVYFRLIAVVAVVILYLLK
jgi:hypothetical protein